MKCKVKLNEVIKINIHVKKVWLQTRITFMTNSGIFNEFHTQFKRKLKFDNLNQNIAHWVKKCTALNRSN